MEKTHEGASDFIQMLAHGLRMRSATIPARRERPRLGRNDKCRCGSGLKYKKCCALNAFLKMPAFKMN